MSRKARRAIGALLLAILPSACGVERELPAELYGVWRTDEPRYADRFIELAAGEIVFGTGGGDSSQHAITSVEAEATPAGGHRLSATRFRGPAPQSCAPPS